MCVPRPLVLEMTEIEYGKWKGGEGECMLISLVLVLCARQKYFNVTGNSANIYFNAERQYDLVERLLWKAFFSIIGAR